MTKHQKLFQEMLEYNQDLFNHFKKLHDEYAVNPESVKDEFNSQGEKVLRVIRRYEDILCSKSEGGKYGKYSGNLAEKFWEAVRGYLPKIDFVGMK